MRQKMAGTLSYEANGSFSEPLSAVRSGSVGRAINLLWSLLMYVEWLALESDFVHSDEVPLHRYVSVGMYWGSSSHPLLPLPVPLARGRWAK